MPYGRPYRKRRYGRRYKSPYKRRFKKRASAIRKSVRKGPKVMQSSVRAPTQRAIMFEDTRTFIVDDTGLIENGDASPICRVLQLNAPNAMFALSNTIGTWEPTDYSSKGSDMPNVSTWITKADGTGNGQYRQASCMSTKVVVSCVPINPGAADAPVTRQAITKLIVRKCTKLTDITDFTTQTPSPTFNGDQMCRQPFTRNADMYRSGDVCKGATITTNYRFSSMNAGPGRASSNTFFTDTSPAEKDFLHITIMPQNKNYASASHRCGQYRIQIKVNSVVQLSEPNTNGALFKEGDGNTFSGVKRRAGEAFYTGGEGDDV